MPDDFARLALVPQGRNGAARELAGGMATVYRAHDLRHDRDVAVKILPSDLGAALGGERFLSESKTVPVNWADEARRKWLAAGKE